MQAASFYKPSYTLNVAYTWAEARAPYPADRSAAMGWLIPLSGCVVLADRLVLSNCAIADVVIWLVGIGCRAC